MNAHIATPEYAEGYAAFSQSEFFTNPYPAGSTKAMIYFEGWLDARDHSGPNAPVRGLCAGFVGNDRTRLESAAPELLAALTDILEANYMPGSGNVLAENARAAIAKAKGGA